MHKPVVTYTDAARIPTVGRGVFIQVLDHPFHLPGTWVTTSPVVSVDGDKFETRNTRYIPGIRDADPPKRFSVELKSDALAVRGWETEVIGKVAARAEHLSDLLRKPQKGN